ncbi:hypothetical protein QOT17_005153 [Balamuthia mandrillaris]
MLPRLSQKNAATFNASIFLAFLYAMDYNYIDKLFVELRTQMASIQASIQAEVRSTKEDLKKEIGGLVERQVR